MLVKYIVLLLLSFTTLFAVVDINNATAEELLELNGIGKSKSQKIVEYRELKKCFKSVDELANIDGISEKIISSNRGAFVLGECKELIVEQKSLMQKMKDVVLHPVNMIFVLMILILAFLDQKTGKDLKSQIVSVGVLGTFVGIFIGLQSFNPQDIENSVNDILVGLKTAFFTSIVGMGVSTVLSVIQQLKAPPENK